MQELTHAAWQCVVSGYYLDEHAASNQENTNRRLHAVLPKTLVQVATGIGESIDL